MKASVLNKKLPRQQNLMLFKIRFVLGFFIVALAISGITAFPLSRELETLTSVQGLENATPQDTLNGFAHWIVTVRDGLRSTYASYPWMAYGTDWLAFAHIAIAVFFLGPWINPVRNVWVLWAGLIACGLVPVLAFICGPIRQIPFGWRLIDCSFGILGAIPLFYCLRLTKKLETISTQTSGN